MTQTLPSRSTLSISQCLHKLADRFWDDRFVLFHIRRPCLVGFILFYFTPREIRPYGNRHSSWRHYRWMYCFIYLQMYLTGERPQFSFKRICALFDRCYRAATFSMFLLFILSQLIFLLCGNPPVTEYSHHSLLD